METFYVLLITDDTDDTVTLFQIKLIPAGKTEPCIFELKRLIVQNEEVEGWTEIPVNVDEDKEEKKDEEKGEEEKGEEEDKGKKEEKKDEEEGQEKEKASEDGQEKEEQDTEEDNEEAAEKPDEGGDGEAADEKKKKKLEGIYWFLYVDFLLDLTVVSE